jgi:hypothetical protein
MTTDPVDGGLVPLGDGTAGTVLAGVDGATGAAYAVKVLPGRLDRRTRAGLDAELRALAGPAGVAPILVAERVVELDDGRPGLRMELCSQSLPELIEAFGPLPIADTVALGTALAEALAAAHRAGVLHGGVTPGNVLFRGSGAPILADFGLTLRRAFPADPARTQDFVAPETLRDGTVDERSDLYGLGAVLQLALTGRPPHTAVPGEPEGAHLLRLLTEPVPPVERDDLPPALGEVVAALLAKDPTRRPPDAAAVAGRLVAVGEAGTGPGAPQPAGEPLLVFGPRRRSRLRVAPGLVAGVVLLAGAALLYRLNQPDELAVPAAPPAGLAPAPARGPSRPAVVLELTAVTDRGDVVDLAWRSSEPLSYAILLAGEDGSSGTFVAQRATTYSVPVDPVRRYCFTVQGTNGVDIYTTAPKPIRGAVCQE